jgi:hypothetical protein
MPPVNMESSSGARRRLTGLSGRVVIAGSISSTSVLVVDNAITQELIAITEEIL